MANSLSIDGTDLSAYSLYVVRGMLPGTPHGDESARSAAQQDGGVISGRVFAPREFTTEVVITGTSYSNLLSNLDSIRQVIMTREDVEVAWDRWDDRYWLGRSVLQDVNLDGPLLARGQIVTTCADPFGYDNDESSHEETSLSIDIGGDSYTVTAAGTARAYPVIVLEYTGAEPNGTAIEHDSLDTRLTYTGALVSGDKLRITCDPSSWLVEKMPDGGETYAAAMDVVEGRWPHLEVGDNVFTIYEFTGDITWTWRDRYI